MAQIPEECPLRDILKEIEVILRLLEKVLDHCDKCLNQGSNIDRNP